MFLDSRPPGAQQPRALIPEVTPKRSWRPRDVVLGVVYATAVIFVISGIIGFVHFELGLEGDARGAALALATIALELSLAGWVLWRARKRGLGWSGLGFVRPRRWGLLWVGWAGAYLVLIGYFAAVLLLGQFGIDVERLTEGNPPPDEVSNSGPLVMAMFGLSVVVLAPLCEELFFRALIYRGLRVIWRVFPALLVSGMLFGLFHQNVSVIVPYSLIGMLFAWVNEESGSLWTSIAAHAAVNALSFTVSVTGAAS